MEGHLRSIVGRLAGTVPATMFNLVQSAQTPGPDVTALLGKLGVESEKQNE